MKTKVLFAAVAVAFSFAVTSCGNKKAAGSTEWLQTLVVLQQSNNVIL
ncbi:MAG: hypothetical protein LUE99_18025 [Bacteroides sp.]|nr:hypothetical protein [Bacteroides sp.]